MCFMFHAVCHTHDNYADRTIFNGQSSYRYKEKNLLRFLAEIKKDVGMGNEATG